MSNDLDELLNQLDDDTQQCESLACPPPEALPVVVEKVEKLTPLSAAPTAAVVDVEKHVRRHEAIADEILSSWRSDRSEAQDAIGLIRGIIDDTVAKGGNPSGTVLEVYVAAIRAKSDTNANAIKLLDATVKLLATTKSTVNISNTQNNVVVGDLDKMLADPIRDDDV